MVVQPQGSLDVNVKMDDREIQKHFEKLPAILPTDRGTISFFQATDSIPVEGLLQFRAHGISQLPLAVP